MKNAVNSPLLVGLIRDIRATFPGLMVAGLSVSVAPDRREVRQMITSRAGGAMPDGLPFFDFRCEAEDCWHEIHPAFDAWLSARGWYFERYDEVWFLPCRLPTQAERDEWARIEQEARATRIGPPTRAQMYSCPF